MRRIVFIFLILILSFSCLGFGGEVFLSGINERSYICFILVPNPCVEVEKVVKGKVYLKDGEGICIQVISVKKVKIEPDCDGYFEIYYHKNLWMKYRIDLDKPDICISDY